MTLTRTKQIAVVIREIYRFSVLAFLLGFLIFGDYEIKKSRAIQIYIIGGTVAYGFLLVLKDRLQIVIEAKKAGRSITQLIFEKGIERRIKSGSIKHPKPIPGRLRYVAAWTLLSFILFPCLALAVVLLILCVKRWPNDWQPLLFIELCLLGILAGIGIVIHRRRLVTKSLGISLTDSMIAMFEEREMRRQERLARLAPLSKNQRYFWNAIGLTVSVALIASRALYMIPSRFMGDFGREMLLALFWMLTLTCPLHALSAYIESPLSSKDSRSTSD